MFFALFAYATPVAAAQNVDSADEADGADGADETDESEESDATQCAEALSAQTVRGTILEIEQLELFEGDDHYRALLAIDDGNEDAEDDMQIDFLVFGKGDLLDVDSDYVVTYNEFEATGGQPFESRAAFLGNDLTCATESTILAIDADGETVPIDVSGFNLPSVPVTPRQVAIGFGALALLTFLFREPRIRH